MELKVVQLTPKQLNTTSSEWINYIYSSWDNPKYQKLSGHWEPLKNHPNKSYGTACSITWNGPTYKDLSHSRNELRAPISNQIKNKCEVRNVANCNQNEPVHQDRCWRDGQSSKCNQKDRSGHATEHARQESRSYAHKKQYTTQSGTHASKHSSDNYENVFDSKTDAIENMGNYSVNFQNLFHDGRCGAEILEIDYRNSNKYYENLSDLSAVLTDSTNGTKTRGYNPNTSNYIDVDNSGNISQKSQQYNFEGSSRNSKNYARNTRNYARNTEKYAIPDGAYYHFEVQHANGVFVSNFDQPDGSYPAELHVTPSTPPALHDLKLCDGLETNSGSHELPPSEPLSANAMMPAPVALQQTRLPPDGHEFPQTYQELQGPKDFLNYTAKTHTMSPANGLPPLPTSNPPVSRKPSRPNSDVFPRDTSCGRNRKDPTPLRREAFCDNKTDHRYKTAENSPSYKYQNKDEKSERSVRDKIAMFSNKSNSGQSSSNLSPTSAHKFVEPLKRPLTRESSPFGLPPSPTSPFKDALILGKENFKNDDFVSHTFLTNLDVDSTYLQNHFQETSVNCQSESSAYSSLSTSEILYDKNSDCNGSDFANYNYNKSSPNQENRVNDGKSDVNILDGSTIESTKRYDIITDIYKQKYTTDLSAGRQNDKLRTNFETPKRSLSDAYNKFNSENRSQCSPGGRKNTPRTPEYKINDFSSLPRKLKVLKSQESRESSPDTNEGYTSKLTRAISFHSPPLLHTRSQSMIDINRNNGADSISKLMEKRKKNISKLKGLIIPEKSEISTSSVTICNLPEIKVKTPSSLFGSTELLDNVSQHNGRPGIIKTPVPLERTVSNPLDLKQTNGYERKRNNSVDNTIDQVDIGRNIEQHNIRMTSSTWDLNDVPKYSPAFKRKSLTVYDKTKPFANQLVSNSVKKVSPPKPPRKSYEGKINNEQIDAIISFDKIKENCNSRKITTKLSSSEGECTDKVSAAPVSRRSVDTLHCSPDDKHSIVTSSSPEKINNKNDRLNPNDRLGVKKLNILTAYNTESSESDDNDSAISSNLSPPLSPLKHDEIDGRNQQRKISTNSSSSSTLTSGDDSIYYPAGDTKRILKPQSVEAVNRKNVLSSAKFRSGDKTNELILKENEPIHEDLARCVDNRLKSAKLDNSESSRKNDEDEYSSSTLNDNEEEDFEFNDECTDKIYSRRLSNIKIAYLDVQVDSAESSDDILSSSDRISEGANSDDEMSVTSSESKLVNGRAVDDWGNTPDEICSKIEEYIDDLEIYSQEIEEKRNKLINERTRRVRRTQESVKIDKFVRTNEFLRNAKMNEANEKLSNTSENKILKEREIVRSPSRNRLDRLKKDIVEPETTETEASIDEVVPKPSLKPSILIKPRLEKASKLDEIKSEYLRSVSKNETVKLSENTTPLSRKTSGLSVARKLTDYSKANVTPLPDCLKPVSSMVDNSKPTMLPAQISRLPSSQHMRVSSLDSTTSDDSFTMQREQFGSITSIASSTSLISQQELQQLIDESNHCLDESNGAGLIPGTSEVSVVVLHRDLPGNSVGITLAGGSDYESKEITVHKVISGTPADRDGRLQKGDRILSINGKSMKGLTHKESLAILKAPRSEVVLVVSRWKPSDTGDSSVSLSPNVTTLSSSLSPSQLTNTLGVSILGSPNSSNTSMTSQNSPLSPVTLSLNSSPSKTTAVRSMVATGLDRSPVQCGDDSSVSRGAPVDVTLIKDGAGLGFSLEGGKDSPFGDQPLTIKKIFTGGCAEKNGQLKAGDEILAINHMPVADLSRIDAWSLLKKLNDGSVLLTLRHKV